MCCPNAYLRTWFEIVFAAIPLSRRYYILAVKRSTWIHPWCMGNYQWKIGAESFKKLLVGKRVTCDIWQCGIPVGRLARNPKIKTFKRKPDFWDVAVCVCYHWWLFHCNLLSRRFLSIFQAGRSSERASKWASKRACLGWAINARSLIRSLGVLLKTNSCYAGYLHW